MTHETPRKRMHATARIRRLLTFLRVSGYVGMLCIVVLCSYVTATTTGQAKPYTMAIACIACIMAGAIQIAVRLTGDVLLGAANLHMHNHRIIRRHLRFCEELKDACDEARMARPE